MQKLAINSILNCIKSGSNCNKCTKSGLNGKHGRYCRAKFEHARRIQPSAKFNEIGGSLNRQQTCLPFTKIKKKMQILTHCLAVSPVTSSVFSTFVTSCSVSPVELICTSGSAFWKCWHRNPSFSELIVLSFIWLRLGPETMPGLIPATLDKALADLST